jgi:hypothetical protein
VVQIVVTLTAIAGGGCSCRRGPAPPRPAGSSPVVAEVGGVAIHAEAVAAEMRRRGLDARQALERLVSFELLAREAGERVGPPEVEDRAEVDAMMVQRLIEREIEPRLVAAAIPDDEVRALYERGKKRFVHGRLVEVAVLAVFTGARMAPEPRARAAATAGALAAAVAARPGRAAADLQALAGDPAWGERGVGFTVTWQSLDEPFPRVLGEAVHALAGPGQTTPLVGDETGYYIARYLSEKPPANVTFDQAAPQLRAEMHEPWRRQKFLRLTMELGAEHEVEVFPDRFPLLAPVR